MKISVDGVELFTIEDHQKKAMMHDIEGELLDEDLKRRLQWVIEHKYDQCLKRLMNDWMPKMKERYTMIPSKDADLVNMITAQHDYKPRAKDETMAEKLKKGTI